MPSFLLSPQTGQQEQLLQLQLLTIGGQVCHQTYLKKRMISSFCRTNGLCVLLTTSPGLPTGGTLRNGFLLLVLQLITWLFFLVKTQNSCLGVLRERSMRYFILEIFLYVLSQIKWNGVCCSSHIQIPWIRKFYPVDPT